MVSTFFLKCVLLDSIICFSLEKYGFLTYDVEYSLQLLALNLIITVFYNIKYITHVFKNVETAYYYNQLVKLNIFIIFFLIYFL